MSKALFQIEEVFGTALFQRSKHGMKATPKGMVVVRAASVMLEEMKHLFEEVGAQSEQGDPPMVVRIGAPPVVALTAVPVVLRNVAVPGTSISILLTEGQTNFLFQALEAGELDALLTTYGPAALMKRDGAALTYEKFGEEAFVVIAPPKHPLAKAKRVDWIDLVKESWIMPGVTSMLRQSIDGNFVRAGAATPKPVIESDSPTTNVLLVSKGLGLSCVPEEAMRDAERLQKVARVRVRPGSLPVPVALVYRASSANKPGITSLRRAVGKMRLRKVK